MVETKLTPEMETKICYLYKKRKLNTVEIGIEYGCSSAKIGRVLKKRGVKRRTIHGENNPAKRPEVRKKISKNLKGHKVSEETKLKISNSLKGKMKGEKHPNWKGGLSYKPYCTLFNDDFKERVRAFWGEKCVICGKTQIENRRKLCVHHVNYDKETCCNTTVPLFISLCDGHHAKTNENRKYWEEMLSNYIMIYFNGVCYFDK